jgi:TP901 family phage tail tape measure protein
MAGQQANIEIVFNAQDESLRKAFEGTGMLVKDLTKSVEVAADKIISEWTAIEKRILEVGTTLEAVRGKFSIANIDPAASEAGITRMVQQTKQAANEYVETWEKAIKEVASYQQSVGTVASSKPKKQRPITDRQIVDDIAPGNVDEAALKYLAEGGKFSADDYQKYIRGSSMRGGGKNADVTLSQHRMFTNEGPRFDQWIHDTLPGLMGHGELDSRGEADAMQRLQNVLSDVQSSKHAREMLANRYRDAVDFNFGANVEEHATPHAGSLHGGSAVPQNVAAQESAHAVESLRTAIQAQTKTLESLLRGSKDSGVAQALENIGTAIKQQTSSLETLLRTSSHGDSGRKPPTENLPVDIPPADPGRRIQAHELVAEAAQKFADLEAKYYHASDEKIENDLMLLKEKKLQILEAMRVATQQEADSEVKILRAQKAEVETGLRSMYQIRRGHGGAPLASMGRDAFSNMMMSMPAPGALFPVQNALQGLGPYGMAAGAAVGVAGYGGYQTIKQGSNVETELAKLSALSGLQGEALQDIRRSSESMAKKFGIEPGEAVNVFRLTIDALGLDLVKNVDLLKEITKDILTLSKAGGAAPNETAISFANLFNQFGYDINKPEEAKAGSYRLMNVLAAGSRQARVEIPDLSEASKDAGTVAHLSGLSPEDLVAALEVMGHVGLQPSQTGVGLRNFLIATSSGGKSKREALSELSLSPDDTEAESEMIGTNPEAKAALGKLGLTFADINPKVVGFTTSLHRLHDALALIPDEVEKADIRRKLFQTRTATVASVLIENVDLLDKWKKAITGTNDALVLSETRMHTFDEGMKRFKSGMENVAVDLFFKHQKFFDDLPAKLEKIIDVLIRLADAADFFLKSPRIAAQSLTHPFSGDNVSGAKFEKKPNAENVSQQEQEATSQIKLVWAELSAQQQQWIQEARANIQKAHEMINRTDLTPEEIKTWQDYLLGQVQYIAKTAKTKLAKGGILTQPTFSPLFPGGALAGEAGAEAVIPLDELPSLIARAMAIFGRQSLSGTAIDPSGQLVALTLSNQREGTESFINELGIRETAHHESNERMITDEMNTANKLIELGTSLTEFYKSSGKVRGDSLENTASSQISGFLSSQAGATGSGFAQMISGMISSGSRGNQQGWSGLANIAMQLLPLFMGGGAGAGLGALGSFTSAFQFADGAILSQPVFSPVLRGGAEAGEHGPEIVAPLHKLPQVARAMGISFAGGSYDPAVVEELQSMRLSVVRELRSRPAPIVMDAFENDQSVQRSLAYYNSGKIA